MGKETRRERFAKYRKEIMNTPDDKFPNSSSKMIVNGDLSSLSLADKPTFAIKYGNSLSNLTDITSVKTKKGNSPYKNYLMKKRKILVLKLVLFLIAFMGMAYWYTTITSGGVI